MAELTLLILLNGSAVAARWRVKIWSKAMNENILPPRLHLNSGIPVLEFEGDWDESLIRSLSEVISKLTLAGHLEIVVNLTRLKLFSFGENRCAEALSQLSALCTRSVRLDIVATKELIGSFVKSSMTRRLHWATSEEEAIGQLKGVPIRMKADNLELRLF